jgi:hypothetical protein
MKDGSRILQWLLNHLPRSQEAAKPGERQYRRRAKTVHTVLGDLELKRDYYYGPKGGRVPLDEKLGLVDSYSPALQRLMCRAGAMDPSYEEASASLQIYGGLTVPGRQIQRLVHLLASRMRRWAQKRTMLSDLPTVPVMYISYDGTAVPMVRRETKGRKGKQPDGSSKTREVKLGCVFTQHTVDKDGLPMRDPDSCSYVATFEEAQVFGSLIRREAIRRGLARAKQRIVLGDGALWVWNLARDCFPGAIQILDFYHACEHLHDLCQALFADPQKIKRQFRAWRRSFKADNVIKVLDKARCVMAESAVDLDAATSEIDYFEKNLKRMMYGTFRKKGFFIGSGVVEAGCKTVVGQRTKQSGMFWTVSGAQDVLDIRCLVLSGSFDDYWQQIA